MINIQGENEPDLLIEQKHYLASTQTVGNSLRYVADLDGQWVALLCFSAASLHLKLREKWLRIFDHVIYERLISFR